MINQDYLRKKVCLFMKKQTILYKACGLLTGAICVCIGVTTHGVIRNMDRQMEIKRTVATAVSSYNNSSSVATQAYTVEPSTVFVTQPTTNVESKSDNVDDFDFTPEVETNEFDTHLFKQYDDGRVAYIVQEGDTLCYVSTLTGYSVDMLAKENEIDDVNLIYTGEAIMIPVQK